MAHVVPLLGLGSDSDDLAERRFPFLGQTLHGRLTGRILGLTCPGILTDAMKLIRTLAHSFDLDRVIESLDREGFHGVTIAEIVHRDSSREGRAHVTLRNQVTLALHDDRVARALSALRQAGCKRDLEVVIEPLAGAVRIRTGEIDEAAIWQ